MARYTKGGDVVRVPQINAELEKIEQAFENTLSRNGDVPNQMNAPIDMNGNKIVNVQTDISDPNSLVQRSDLYVKSEVDAKDTSTLQAAKSYADSVAVPNETVDAALLRTQLADVDSNVLVGGQRAKDLGRKFEELVSVRDFGAVGDNVTDDTQAFQDAINYCISTQKSLYITGGNYRITNTLQINNSFSLTLQGMGERETILNFDNVVEDKVMFDLTKESSNSVFKDMQINDVNGGTSIAFRATEGIRGVDGGSISHYKDSLERCRVSSFKVGFWFDTDGNELDANEHIFLSEPMFFHTRFKNCRTSFLVQNIQAVDITLVGTDIENDDAGEEYTILKDTVGASFRMYGGSVVGKGFFYDGDFLAGSVSLWQAGKIYVNDTRFEIRATRLKDFIKIPQSNAQLNLQVEFDSCMFLCFGQRVRFVDYLGKIDLKLKQCRTLSGSMFIEHRPYQFWSGTFTNPYYFSNGSIALDDCFGIDYEKGAPASGDPRYTVRVDVTSKGGDGSFNAVADADDFISYDNKNYHQWACGLNRMESTLLTYALDSASAGIGDVKVFLPKGARPAKLVMWKDPTIRTSDVNYELYFVKDKADWATTTFDEATDAILIATTGSTAGQFGEVEVSIAPTANNIATFKAGESSWEEGRLFFKAVGGVQNRGFVGVRYY